MIKILAKKIEQRPIASLVPYATNSRTHSDAQVAQLAASFREFGFTNPVLIDERGGLIAGHGRVMAAKAVGLNEVPCIVLAGLSDAQRRAYVIADNKLALNAEWDEELLRREMSALDAEGFDLDVIGFADGELEKLGGEQTERQEPPAQGDYQEKFSIVVVCAGESDQRAKYDALVAGGYECRILVN